MENLFRVVGYTQIERRAYESKGEQRTFSVKEFELTDGINTIIAEAHNAMAEALESTPPKLDSVVSVRLRFSTHEVDLQGRKRKFNDVTIERFAPFIV